MTKNFARAIITKSTPLLDPPLFMVCISEIFCTFLTSSILLFTAVCYEMSWSSKVQTDGNGI